MVDQCLIYKKKKKKDGRKKDKIDSSKVVTKMDWNNKKDGGDAKNIDNYQQKKGQFNSSCFLCGEPHRKREQLSTLVAENIMDD
ncbi:unnamed protein product, partial [Ilex paraguariensis]